MAQQNAPPRRLKPVHGRSIATLLLGRLALIALATGLILAVLPVLLRAAAD